MYYILDDHLELTRQELVDLLVDIIEEDKLKLRNVLPQYSIRQNCKHHPVRMAREIGYKVEAIRIRQDKSQ